VLQVASTNKAELEPNSSVGAAQALAASDSIVGTAALSDAQSLLVPTDQPVHDFYRLTVGAENVRVVLTMAKDDTNTNDLDLFLLDDSGNTLLTSSEGVDQLTETVTTPGPGTYIVGVRAFAGTSEYLLSAGTTSTSSSFDRETTPAGAEFVAGELLVKYKQSASMQSLAAKHNMVPQSHVWNDAHLMKLTQPIRALGTPADGAKKMNGLAHEKNEALGRTLEALQKLRKDPTVAYAEPNYIRRALVIPNDQFYPLQWHYPAINLPQAWDVATTRGANTIVAVIDTGILSGHPDFAGQLVGGYDFISDADRAGDGNGRDANPEDEGDGNRPGESSYHGTHVAGTVAAATNNTIGVAGVAWNTKIMALRVLGKGGGTDVDIMESIKFAARLTNASGTVPPVKADVINMSLGGAGASQTTQDVITAARAAGVVVVAAAGNDNSSQLFFPASYDGVISVSAVAYDLKRAPYSNFGTAIDIAAPGGDTSADLNGDKYSDGVLSLLKDDSSTPAVFNFVFYQGTSMACPHMAGVIALMRGVNSTITPAQVDSLISSGKITTDLGTPGRDNIFGHGLVDASKAVTEAGNLGGGGPAPTGSALSLSAASLNFDSFLDRLTVNVSNAGSGVLNISSITENESWLTVAPATGIAPFQLNVTVNRAGLADGSYTGIISVVSDAAQGDSIQTIEVSMRVSSATGAGDVGTVFVLLINPSTGNALDQQASTTRAEGYRFSITGIPAGTYDIFAGTDRDNDDFICDIEDACGTLGRSVTIAASGQITGVDFPVNNSQNQPQVLVKNRSGAKPLVKQVR
jgi:serine protease